MTYLPGRPKMKHSIISQVKLDEAEEEGDQTGDSGKGTGSGTTKYGNIEEWKKGIQNPPPGMCIHYCWKRLTHGEAY